MKLLLYCTKSRLKLRKSVKDKIFYLDNGSEFNIIPEEDKSINGKIVAECDFEVEEIKYFDDDFGEGELYTETLNIEELERKSCVGRNDLYDYLQNKYFQRDGYAIHIKNLHIFDELKELSDYYKFDGIYNNINNWKTIDKAPQNMMYAYDLISELGFSGTYNIHLKENILISIRPEWLCKILNGEKTIEVRKKVLKEMLNNE